MDQQISYPLTIKWHRSFEDFFVEKNLYLGTWFKIRGIWKEGDVVWLKDRAVAEPYASMPPKTFYSSGSFSYSNSYFPHAFRVGRYCSIGDQVQVMGDNHPMARVSTSPLTYEYIFQDIARDHFNANYEIEPYPEKVLPLPIIGNDVWIGTGAMLARNIRIGDGAVIAARSVVTRDVPPYAMVAGAPAQIRKMRFNPIQVGRLLALQWWKYNYFELPRCWSEIDRFLETLEDCIARQAIREFSPGWIDIGAELTKLGRTLNRDDY